jgi:predicted nucleic acid-binding protein
VDGAPSGEVPVIVLDASVGVKWMKPEVGREEARGLLEDHRDGRVRLVVPALFVLEVVAVAVRHGGPVFGERTWRTLQLVGLTAVGLDDELAAAAFEQCRRLGCSFYDALAPALADRLSAPLVSADRRAHGAYPGVRLIRMTDMR